MQEIHKAPGSRKVEIPISEKYMLTINEAAAYISIGVKKLRRMAEGELEKEFSDLFREAGYAVSVQALKEIKLCTFSIANFSRYKISDKPGRTGQVRLVQTQSGLALCSHAGERDDFYIGLSILKGNYIDKDFPCGFIDKPIEVRRKNKELVILYDGDEV